MANSIISQGSSGMSMTDLERAALKQHIASGLLALNQREFPKKITDAIKDGLEEVKSIYKELTKLEIENSDKPCYANLIEETLEAFTKNCEYSSIRYREYLKAVMKLINDMMIVLSLTYGTVPEYRPYVSECYDRLLNFEHKISNSLTSNK